VERPNLCDFASYVVRDRAKKHGLHHLRVTDVDVGSGFPDSARGLSQGGITKYDIVSDGDATSIKEKK
jgi:hypothetical protein